MTMQDPIADLLTRVRNAQMAGHVEVQVPHSKAKCAILDVLVSELCPRLFGFRRSKGSHYGSAEIPQWWSRDRRARARQPPRSENL